MAWGPGNAPNGNITNAPTGNQSPVYVTALADTTVTVIYPDGTQTDFGVNRLEQVTITAPNNDMTGAILFTGGTPFAAVWGQDPTADRAFPSIDVGTGIAPIQSLAVQKDFELLVDADCTGGITTGDTVEFRLQYLNESVNSVPNVILADLLPGAVTYVPDSIVVDGTPRSDASGATNLFNPAVGLGIGDVAGRGAGLLTFRVVVNDTSGPITNRARIAGDNAVPNADTATILIPSGTPDPILVLDYTLVDPASGPAIVGQVITFNLSIQNAGPTSVLTLPLQVAFNPDDLSFVNASVNPDSQNPGQLDWANLTTTLGTLAPSGTISLTTSYVVNRVPTNNSTTVRATVLEAEVEAQLPPLVCRTEAAANIGQPPPPTPTPVPTSPPSGGGDRDRDDPTATPRPATPVAEAVALPPELPVAFLPETGIREMALTSRGLELIGGAGLLLTLSGSMAIILYVRRKTRKK